MVYDLGTATRDGKAVTQLQGVQTLVATGQTANTDIDSIPVGATLESVVGHDPDAVAAADTVVNYSAQATITSAGKLQTSVDTSAYQLVVRYFPPAA